MPTFIKIGQTAAKIWRFNGSQNGGRLPSWICEIRIFLTVGAVKSHILHQRTKFHLEFSKIRNFNGLSAVAGQSASLCQILSKSVKRVQR